METIKIQGKLSSDDYLQSALLNLSRFRGVFILIGLIFAFSFTVMLVTNWSLGIPIIQYSLPVLILPGIYLLWRYLILPKNINRIFNQQKDLHSPFTIEISEDDFIYSNEYGQTKRPWSNIVKWKENDQIFSIYHSDVALTIIPKRSFINQDQINLVQTFLSNTIAPKKAGHSSRPIVYVVLFIFVSILCVSSYMNQLQK
jgi:hypothetical protein